MEDMRDRKKIISAAGAVVLIVISVITVIPLLKLGVYDHPCADDFGYSIQTYQVWQETHSVGELIKTAWSTSIRFWHTWQGLYISAFVLALQPAIFGEAYYALTVWLTVGTIYGANLIFAEYVLHYKLKGSALGAMALAFTMSMVMVQWIPSAVQGLYWYNGAMNYTFFYGIFLLLIIGEISLHTAGSWWKYVLKVLGTLFLGIILMGGNHVTALCGLVLGILACGLAFLQKKWRTAISSLLVAVGILTGFLINVCSPGTAVRQADFSVRPGFWGTIIKAVKQGIVSMNDWIGLGLLLCVAGILPLAMVTAKKICVEKGYGFRYPLVVFVASVAWICMMFCPPIYATGAAGDGRLWNVVYFVFVLLVFVNEFYLCGWLCTRMHVEIMERAEGWNCTGRVAAGAVLALGLIMVCRADATFYEARGELIYEQAQEYSVQADQRVELYLNSAGEDVSVSAYTTQPKLLYFDDITSDAADWRNTSVRDYYGLNSVVISE